MGYIPYSGLERIMSESINLELQSTLLLETLRQTPDVQEHDMDSGGSALAAGDGNMKGISTSSLSSSADGRGGIGANSDGNGEKNGLEAMDPAILSSTISPDNDSSSAGNGKKSNRKRYTANQMLALRNVELSKKKPILHDNNIIGDSAAEKRFNIIVTLLKPASCPCDEHKNGLLGNYGRNRVVYSSTNNNSGASGNNGNGSGNSGGGNNAGRVEMRRSGGLDLRDPKDRLRKEDGIVLSPQRRSFNMGCQMPAAPTTGTSSLTIGGSLLRPERDILGGRERRIGSGRILSRDVSWDYRPDKDIAESNDYRTSNNLGFRDNRDRETRDSREREPRETRDSRGDRNERDKDFRKDFDRDRDRDREERYERRPLNRDYERNDKESRNVRMGSRYSTPYNSNNDSHGGSSHHSSNFSSNSHYHSNYHDRRRQYDNGRDEEPEWFSEPTSQSDTIELRGFDDPVPDEETKPDKSNERDDSKHDLPDVKSTSKDTKRPPSSLQNDKNNNSRQDQLLSNGVGSNTDKTNATSSLTPGDTAQQDRTPGDGSSESSTKSAAGPAVSSTNTLAQSKIANDDFNFEDFLKLDALPSNLLYVRSTSLLFQ